MSYQFTGLECTYCLDVECENVGGPWPCTSDPDAFGDE